MNCLACGDHPLNYIHCDRWDCPLLVARAKIEGLRALGYRQAVTAIGMPFQGWGSETEAIVVPMGPEDEIVGEDERFFSGGSALGDILDMPEEEREPDPPDEDDDEIAVDWDENGFWPSENDETEDEEE